MTVLELFLNNRKVLNDSIGKRSYMITVDHIKERFESVSGTAGFICNDVPRMFRANDEEPLPNVGIFFHGVLMAARMASRKIGEGHEDWNEVSAKLEELNQKNPSAMGHGFPVKYYYPIISKCCNSLSDIMVNTFWMTMVRHQFVIYLIRDRTIDQSNGGYVFQIHCYGFQRNNDDDIEKKFLSIFFEELFNIMRAYKCPTKVLTNPSIFHRLYDWLARSYIRFNGTIYGLCRDIYMTIKGAEYSACTRK